MGTVGTTVLEAGSIPAASTSLLVRDRRPVAIFRKSPRLTSAPFLDRWFVGSILWVSVESLF